MSNVHDTADAAHVTTRQAAERWVEKRVFDIALRQKTLASEIESPPSWITR